MIKKLLALFLCIALIGGFTVSCGESDTETGTENPTPEPEPEPTPTPDDGVAFNPYPDVPTPIKVFKNKVEGGSEGLSIEVTEIENDNFVFNVRPGEFVQSYRLDVFPLCRLYNSLFEQMKSEGKSVASERDIDTWIREFVFNSEGAGAFTFDAKNHADYADKEFDWMNTSYAQAYIVPDAEYLIVGIACFDTEGVEDGDMSLCYVRTTAEPLIGNPEVQFDVKVNYRAMQVTHYPNTDCKYLYYWASDESDLMPYINTYGRKLYSDFMRHTIGDAIAADDENNLWYYRDFGYSASSESPIMATAIGLDENKTPAEDFNSVVFTLKPIPEGLEMGSGEIKPIEDKIGASYLWYEYTVAANTPVMFWQIFTPEQAKYYQTQATEEELTALAQQIDAEGWALVNEKYSYDEATGKFGDSYTGRTVLYAEPDSEFVFGCVARNRARELSDVFFTDVIKTKPLVTDKPEECQSDCQMTLTSDSRTEFKIRFDYDFEKHAGVRFQYIEPVLEGGTQIPATSTREEFIEYLGFGKAGDTQGMVINNWHGEPRGVDGFTYVVSPGEHYKFVAMFEDWNGVIGDVVFGEVTTQALEPGDNPVAEVTVALNGNKVTYTFTANNDTAYMQYLTLDSSYDDYLKLKELGSADHTAATYITLWREICMEIGMQTDALRTYQEMPADALSAAVCIPFGKDDVRGDVAYIIWDGTKACTLEDYYPVAATAVNNSAHKLQMAPAHTGKAIPAAEYKMPREENRSDVKEFYLIANMQRLASHPLASNN